MTEIDYDYANQQELELKTNIYEQTNNNKLKYHEGAQKLAVMVATQQRRFNIQSCKAQASQDLAAKWRMKRWDSQQQSKQMQRHFQ